MYKQIINIAFVFLFCSGISTAEAQSNKAYASHFINKEVVVPEIKNNQEARLLKIDTKGANYLMLVAEQGSLGRKNDYALWADAKVYLKDGSFVWLDKLNYKRFEALKGGVKRNVDYNGGEITIKGKKYNNGVLIWGPGVILYELPENSVGFEAEVGIDDSSKSGSVNFKAYAVNNQFLENEALFNQLFNLHRNIKDWVLDPVAKGLPRVINQLSDKNFYSDLLKNTTDYETFSKELLQIYNIQEQLK